VRLGWLAVGIILGLRMARRLSSGYPIIIGRDRGTPSQRKLSTGDVAMLSAFHRDAAIFTKGKTRDLEWVAGQAGEIR